MNLKFKAECEKLARLIQPKAAAAWPTEYFTYWANELAHEISRQGLLPARGETKRRLSGLVEAVDALADGLDEPTIRFFLANMYGNEFEEEVAALQKTLPSIRSRIYSASRSSFVLNETGKTKRGRGKTRLPGAEKPEVLCALVVAEAWNFVRRKYPGARNRDAAQAASALWAVSCGSEKKSWGNSLSGWRQYFETALSDKLAAQRAECLRILRAVHAHAKVLGVEI